MLGSRSVPRPPVDRTLREELEGLTASICRALDDPKRLYILYLLDESPMSVRELCEALEISQANASQHLAVLRERGVVEAERRGSRVVYSLRHQKVLEAIDVLREVMADETARRQGLVTRGRAPQAGRREE